MLFITAFCCILCFLGFIKLVCECVPDVFPLNYSILSVLLQISVWCIVDLSTKTKNTEAPFSWTSVLLSIHIQIHSANCSDFAHTQEQKAGSFCSSLSVSSLPVQRLQPFSWALTLRVIKSMQAIKTIYKTWIPNLFDKMSSNECVAKVKSSVANI